MVYNIVSQKYPFAILPLFDTCWFNHIKNKAQKNSRSHNMKKPQLTEHHFLTGLLLPIIGENKVFLRLIGVSSDH